jgi:hypothetical protein
MVLGDILSPGCEALKVWEYLQLPHRLPELTVVHSPSCGCAGIRVQKTNAVSVWMSSTGPAHLRPFSTLFSQVPLRGW